MKKAPKKKSVFKYQDGTGSNGVVDPGTLSPKDKATYDNLTTDQEKYDFLNSRSTTNNQKSSVGNISNNSSDQTKSESTSSNASAIASSAGDYTGWYGAAMAGSSAVKEGTSKDEYGNPKTGKDQAIDEFATDSGTNALNEVEKGNYQNAVREITGFGKIGRGVTDYLGHGEDTTGMWGDINKAYGNKEITDERRKQRTQNLGEIQTVKDGGEVKASNVSKGKAKEILKDGTVHNKPLSKKQRGLFGWIAGGRKKEGGEVNGYESGGDVLSTAERKKLSKEDFAFPDKRAYPIHNMAHAKNALARVSQFGSDEEKAHVRKMVEERYPEMKQSKSEGGMIEGPGGPKDDAIAAKVEAHSQIVPAENAHMAEMIRKKYLGKNKKAKLNQKGETPVMLSDGEHMFTPDENEYLKSIGVNVSDLAPNAKTGMMHKDGTTKEGVNPADYKVTPSSEEDDIKSGERDAETIAKIEKDKKAKEEQDALLNQTPEEKKLEEDALAATNKSATSPSAKKKKGIDQEGIFAATQTGLGLYNLLKDGKRPEDFLDPAVNEAVERALSQSNYGYDAATKNIYDKDIELARSQQVGLAAQTAGANPQRAMSNARVATNDYAENLLKLASADNQLRLQKQQYSDKLVANRAEQKRRLFEDKMRAFDINQQTGADLLGAGIQNYFGNRWRNQDLEATKASNAVSNPSYGDAIAADTFAKTYKQGGTL